MYNIQMDIRYKSRIIQAKQQRRRRQQTGGEFFFSFKDGKKIPRSAHVHFLRR